jgi:DNA-binding transcriptional ArsR family regulator
MIYICIMTQKNMHLSSTESTAACCATLGDLLNPGFFKALGDSRRQEILFRLAVSGGECTVSQVAEGQSVDVSVISRHLAQLRDAGVLAAERHGKEVRYTVRYTAIVRLLRQLADAIEGCCPEDYTTCCTEKKEQRP